MQHAAAAPAGRYGAPARTRSRGLVVTVVVVSVAFLGWVVWAGLGAAAPDVRGEVTGFRIVSGSAIQVRVAAGAGTGSQLACTVRALDRTREVVGVAGVALDPDTRAGRERWVTVRTRDRAVTAMVGECVAT
ncbi:MAG: DUF4307 domain-containing protein [Sporichthyaceae bacterium]|nr:DUF4307 domain-containing protein [Sporichthyaceae bacterium]